MEKNSYCAARVESRGPSFFFDFRRPRRNNAACFAIHLKAEGLSARACACVCVFKQLPFVVAFRRFFETRARMKGEEKL